jgi:flagellar motor component MotA
MSLTAAISSLADLWLLLTIVISSFVIAVIPAMRGEIGRAIAAVAAVLRADPIADGQAALSATGRLSKLDDLRELVCPERIETVERFLRRAARRLVACHNVQEFSRWATAELTAREARHHGAIAVWQRLAFTAPAFGLLLTLASLVPSLALISGTAFLPLFYGLALAMLAGPIALRLARFSKAKLAWQQAALACFERLAQAELAPAAPRARPMLYSVS